MLSGSALTLLKILLQHSSAKRFIVGVTVGFAFSIAVILGTVGLMDGFDYSLKMALKRSSGDLLIYSHDGFFLFDKELKPALLKKGITEFTPFVQTEGFLIHKESSKGILIKGVDSPSFSKVTALPIQLSKNEIIIGEALAELLQLKVGERVVLAFASGDKGSLIPLLRTFQIKGIVKHGVYRKDIRFVYVDRTHLQEILGLNNYVNLVSLNVKRNPKESLLSPSVIKRIEENETQLLSSVGFFFKIRPFWQEFSTLFEAVKIQKFVISLIFQLIVLISIFNLMAFIIYLNEKRSQEIFLFESLGLSRRQLMSVWTLLGFILWGGASLLSVGMVQLLSLFLKSSHFLNLPGEIYNLSQLEIRLTWVDYLYVDSLALLWVFLMMLFVVIRLRKKSILQGLRKEFS